MILESDNDRSRKISDRAIAVGDLRSDRFSKIILVSNYVLLNAKIPSLTVYAIFLKCMSL